MTEPLADRRTGMTRRSALAGGAAGALSLSSLRAEAVAQSHQEPQANEGEERFDSETSNWLPTRQMDEILKIRGKITHGLYHVSVVRHDMTGVTGMKGVPISPGFQLNGDIFVQPLAGGGAIANLDLCFRPGELQAAIKTMLANDIEIEAFHQHFYDFSPMVYFIHARAQGEPLRLAQAFANVLSVSGTPLPQGGERSRTPLDVEAIGRILGAPGHVGDDATVTYFLPRREPLKLGGVRINPYLNTATNIVFAPLDSEGDQVAVAPDFAMNQFEIDDVLRTMQGQGFLIGCLYNQETDESPQLFFSHQMAIGEPLDLARKVRRGLNQTNVLIKTQSARASE